jgi:hypothetical protein
MISSNINIRIVVEMALNGVQLSEINFDTSTRIVFLCFYNSRKKVETAKLRTCVRIHAFGPLNL